MLQWWKRKRCFMCRSFSCGWVHRWESVQESTHTLNHLFSYESASIVFENLMDSRPVTFETFCDREIRWGPWRTWHRDDITRFEVLARHRQALGLLKSSWTSRTKFELMWKWHGDVPRWQTRHDERRLDILYCKSEVTEDILSIPDVERSDSLNPMSSMSIGDDVHTDTCNSSDSLFYFPRESTHLLETYMSFWLRFYIKLCEI